MKFWYSRATDPADSSVIKATNWNGTDFPGPGDTVFIPSDVDARQNRDKPEYAGGIPSNSVTQVMEIFADGLTHTAETLDALGGGELRNYSVAGSPVQLSTHGSRLLLRAFSLVA